MDTLDEREIESIWRRVKKYIPTNRIKGATQEEVLQQIGQYMREAGEEEGESGSMETLVKNGFASNDGLGRTQEFQRSLDNWLTREAPAIRPEVEEPTTEALPKVKMFKSGRASIATRRGKRIYSQKNLRVSFSQFKGRQSYYVYNTRTKKRITWGVL